MCDLPPCPPCPAKTPPPCPQVCPSPPKPPVCYGKPIMRGLHWVQTQSIIAQAFVLAALGGFSYYCLVGYPRKERYRDFYETTENLKKLWQKMKTEAKVLYSQSFNQFHGTGGGPSKKIYMSQFINKVQKIQKLWKGEFEDWADEMARKGLFQSVPSDTLKDKSA